MMRLCFLAPLITVAHLAQARYLMYLTGQHNVVPDKSQLADLTHIALAFMRPHIFNQPNPTSWPTFTTVEEARAKFVPGTAIMVSIGGWGDTEGFEAAARTQHGRELFARNVKKMVDETGADGVDINWEYPGGNGEDYKRIPNSQKAWQISAFPLLLGSLRTALGPHSIMSISVPGLTRDMLAFTSTTVPLIDASIDFWNIMTYMLMNRRDNITKHFTGVQISLDAVNAYESRGVPTSKMNLGFAFFNRYFKTDPNGGCEKNPIGCRTMLLEDPETGADLGGVGGFSYHDAVPGDVAASWARAQEYGEYDPVGGGHYYWDPHANLWWTWDTPYAIEQKFPKIMEKKKLGGAFSWGLGEDAPDFVHLTALTAQMKRYGEGEKSEDEGWATGKDEM